MNKKFTTLLAGFLLAGGLFSSIDAENFSDIAGDGQYYRLVRSAQYQDGGGWDANMASYPLYLVQEKGESAYISNELPSEEASLWKIEKTKSLGVAGDDVFSFVNILGETLTFTDADGKKQTKFYSENSNGDQNYIRLDAATAGVYHIQMTYSAMDAENPINWAAYTTSTGSKYSLAFDAVPASETIYKVSDLKSKLKDGFYLDFSHNDKKYTDIKGNVFSGKLKPIAANDDGEDATLYYLTSGDKYITLTKDVWGENNNNLDGSADAYMGYKFTTLSKHAFDKLDATEKKNAQFTIKSTYKREFGIRNLSKKVKRQLEKAAVSFGNSADI